MLKKQAITLGLAIAGCSALWSVGAVAQTDDTQATLKALQQQIQLLQHQVTDLQNKQSTTANSSQASDASIKAASSGDAQASPAAVADSGPTKKLNISGGVATEYQLQNSKGNQSRRDGGDLIFDYFALGVDGQYGKLTYSAQERFSSVNFQDSSFLQHGWAAWDFDDAGHHQVIGGFFQVPFGNLPLGYQSFWGSLAYFGGFTDNQAAGVGYKYENGAWRFDLDAFKNDDLEQGSTYGSNPSFGYQQVNGGSARVGYTFNNEGQNTLNVSAAVRGGELEVGTAGTDSGVTSDYGNHWAATVAADAKVGLWTLQGQYIDYRYNIPENRTSNGVALPTNAITIENYGFGYQMPASGQFFTGNVARDFPVDLGPISNIQIYNNYGYLKNGGSGRFDSSVPGSGNAFNSSGDAQLEQIGAALTAGPVYFWADMMMAKNGAMAFIGPNDGDWHPRFNLTAAFYFDGDLIK